MGKMSAALGGLLRRAGIYHRLKASPLYDVYWGIADRRILDERNREVRFYRSLLSDVPRPWRIYDIGANHGYKTDIFLRLGAHVVAVDPDPVNGAILAEKFHRFRIKNRPVEIVEKAVSREAGRVTLWIDEPGSAKNTLSTKWVDALREDSKRFGHTLTFSAAREVEATTISDLVQTFGAPTFIKIDVEGHELDVIRGITSPTPYLSFEVNLPEFLDEGLQCIAALLELDPSAAFNYSADLKVGLALDRWLPGPDFIEVVRTCDAKCIEVFSRTLHKVPT